MATRTKIIGTATTLTITSILLWMAFNQNFILNASKDITCSGIPYYDDAFKREISDCQVFWNVTSINYNYYFKNKEGINLSFIPEVKGWDWYIKDSRYNSGWKILDKSGNFTFKKGIKYQFMAFIFKEPKQTIKWKITAAEQTIDPVLFGIELQDCKTTTELKNYPISEICFEDSVYIDNSTKVQKFVTRKNFYNYSCTRSYYTAYINTTTCETYGYNVNGKIIDFRDGKRKCYLNSPYLTCKVQYQSNMDYPNCLSGERCEIIDIRTMAIQFTGGSPTKQLEAVKIN